MRKRGEKRKKMGDQRGCVSDGLVVWNMPEEKRTTRQENNVEKLGGGPKF